MNRTAARASLESFLFFDCSLARPLLERHLQRMQPETLRRRAAELGKLSSHVHLPFCLSANPNHSYQCASVHDLTKCVSYASKKNDQDIVSACPLSPPCINRKMVILCTSDRKTTSLHLEPCVASEISCAT